MTFKKLIVAVLTITLSFGLFGFVQFKPKIKTGDPVVGSVDNEINLAQGWTPKLQQAFYFTNQGSRIMPYEWFLALEQADSQELFSSEKNIKSLRYIPTTSTLKNPDALPVGFAKDVSPTNVDWVGLTCAACHTAQISYKGTNIRIDGGPTLGNFERFNTTLVSALQATSNDKEKFERFATKILGKNATARQRKGLHKRLVNRTNVLDKRNKINHSGVSQPHYGFGRVDAIGAIFSQVMVTFNQVDKNIRPSDAPVSYPFLWGTDQSDVVQWTGFSSNEPRNFGPLGRNAGEVLGVYGQITIPKNKKFRTYNSSIDIINLGKLERWVTDLRAPQWPEDYLPKINKNLAQRGERLYGRYCISCHQVVSPRDQGMRYNAVLTPISKVGTDPTEWINMNRQLLAGRYEGRRTGVLPLLGDLITSPTPGLPALTNADLGALLDQPLRSVIASVPGFSYQTKTATTTKVKSKGKLPSLLKDYLQQYEKSYEGVANYTKPGETESQKDDAVYKARPLNGIWATAPYLHNGSVPNLYELLLPEEERSQIFYVGNLTFDPKKVGYVSTQPVSDGIALSKFDTSLKGNSNHGHEYATHALQGNELWALLEYLKTL